MDGEATVAVVYLDSQSDPRTGDHDVEVGSGVEHRVGHQLAHEQGGELLDGHASPFRQRRGDEPPGRACPRRLGSEMGGCVLAATR